MNNDICLLKVPNLKAAAPAACDGCWAPACLPNSPPPAYKHCWVAGWGTTAWQGNASNKLREVGVNIFSEAECKKTGYGSNQIDYNTEFCAGRIIITLYIIFTLYQALCCQALCEHQAVC